MNNLHSHFYIDLSIVEQILLIIVVRYRNQDNLHKDNNNNKQFLVLKMIKEVEQKALIQQSIRM